MLDTDVRRLLDGYVGGLLAANPGMAAKDVAKLVRLDEIPKLTGFSGKTLRECNVYAKKQITLAVSREKKASGREDRRSALVAEYDGIRVKMEADLAEYRRLGGDPLDFARKAEALSAAQESHDPKKRQRALEQRNKEMKRLLTTVRERTKTLDRGRKGLVAKSDGLEAASARLDSELGERLAEYERLGGDCSALARRRGLVAAVPARGDEAQIDAVNRRHAQLERRHDGLGELVNDAVSAIAEIEKRRGQLHMRCNTLKKECALLESDLGGCLERCRQLGGERADLKDDLAGIRGSDVATATAAAATATVSRAAVAATGVTAAAVRTTLAAADVRGGGKRGGAAGDLEARHRLLEGRRNRLDDLKRRATKWIALLENLDRLKADMNGLAAWMEQACAGMLALRTTGTVPRHAVGITHGDARMLHAIIREARDKSTGGRTAMRGGGGSGGGGGGGGTTATQKGRAITRARNESIALLEPFAECLDLLMLYNDLDDRCEKRRHAMSGPTHVFRAPHVSTDPLLSLENLRDGLEALGSAAVEDLPGGATEALRTRLEALRAKLRALRAKLRALRAKLRALNDMLKNEADMLDKIHRRWSVLVEGVPPSGDDPLCKEPRPYSKVVSSVKKMGVSDGNITQMIENMQCGGGVGGGNSTATATASAGSGPNLLLDSSTIISMYREVDVMMTNMTTREVHKHVRRHVHRHLEETGAKLVIAKKIISESSPILNMAKVDLEDWFYDQFGGSRVEIIQDRAPELESAQRIHLLDANRLSVYMQRDGRHCMPAAPDPRQNRLMSMCMEYHAQFRRGLNVFYKRNRFRKPTYESIQYTSRGMADRILSEPDCLLLYLHCTCDDLVLITQDYDLAWSCIENAGLEDPRDASTYSICSRFAGMSNR